MLIKVKAAGVNRSDVITRQNTDTYGKGSGANLIPGLEVSPLPQVFPALPKGEIQKKHAGPAYRR